LKEREETPSIQDERRVASRTPSEKGKGGVEHKGGLNWEKSEESIMASRWVSGGKIKKIRSEPHSKTGRKGEKGERRLGEKKKKGLKFARGPKIEGLRRIQMAPSQQLRDQKIRNPNQTQSSQELLPSGGTWKKREPKGVMIDQKGKRIEGGIQNVNGSQYWRGEGPKFVESGV